MEQVTLWQLWLTQLGASGRHAEHASELSHLTGALPTILPCAIGQGPLQGQGKCPGTEDGR